MSGRTLARGLAKSLKVLERLNDVGHVKVSVISPFRAKNGAFIYLRLPTVELIDTLLLFAPAALMDDRIVVKMVRRGEYLLTMENLEDTAIREAQYGLY